MSQFKLKKRCWVPRAKNHLAHSICFLFAAYLGISPSKSLADPQPLSVDAQNYLVESSLAGVYHHSSLLFREFRIDGLLTIGLSRFNSNPQFCFVGGQQDIQNAVRAVLEEAVPLLTANRFEAQFPQVGCPIGLEPCNHIDCVDLPPSYVLVYLENCGTHTGSSCWSDNQTGMMLGDEIVGGKLKVGPISSAVLSNQEKRTIRHELGHVFGLRHTWGEPDIMSYRDRTDNYSSLEQEAFGAIYSIDPGLGLQDLIALGIVEDDPEVLDQQPVIYHTEISREEFGLDDRTFDPNDRNIGSVGDKIYIIGKRLTMAFRSESSNTIWRRLGYSPPIVDFGVIDIGGNLYSVSVVPDLRESFQGREHLGFYYTWFGWPAGILKVKIPQGAYVTENDPLTLTTRGQSATLPSFVIDGDSIQWPEKTSLPVRDFTCERGVGGSSVLNWVLPTTYADLVTPFNPAQAVIKAIVLRNGIELAQLDVNAATTTFTDEVNHGIYETDLYQIVLNVHIGGITWWEGIPSTICTLSPRKETGEVTLFVIDRTGSMTTLRVDGSTRFEGVVGPLPPPEVPRAFEILEEVFSAQLPPKVAIYSYNHVDPIIDEVAEYRRINGLFPIYTFTSDKTEAEDVLFQVQERGATGGTPLVDAVCISGDFLMEKFHQTIAGMSTMRIFTDGEENFSIGVEECPISCYTDLDPPYAIDWDYECRPGTCPEVEPGQAPESCTQCQLDLFRQYCGEDISFFVEYFGPGGSFSPLPPDSGYLFDLAEATGGRFVWNTDDLSTVLGIPGDLPPIVDIGEDQTVECLYAEGTPVTLDGIALDELRYSELTFSWAGSFPEGGGNVQGPSPTVTLPIGSHMVKLVVWDGHQRSTPVVTQVNIFDTTPPVVSDLTYFGPSCLWPPDHKYVVLRVGRDFKGAAEDTCDPNPHLIITGADSNQPDNSQGDGNTVNDVVVFPDRVCIRAERQGNDRDGRIYTISLGSIDASGNESDSEVVQVRVPHDQRPSSRCTASKDLEIVEDGDPICDPSATAVSEGVKNESVESRSEGGCSTGTNGGTGFVFLGLFGLAILRRRRRRI